MSFQDPVRRILVWRAGVPTRAEREDPFADVDEASLNRPASVIGYLDDSYDSIAVDGIDTEYPPDLPPRPPGRLGFVRTDTAVDAGSSKKPSGRKSCRSLARVLAYFSRNRKEAAPMPPPIISPDKPVHMNFLFVGGKGSGQTSLLFRSRFGYFPDVNGLGRTMYESYPKSDIYHGQPDTSGAPDLNTVERLAHVVWHGIFLCFDIGQKVSMMTIVQWLFLPLVLLVGNKCDLRQSCPGGTANCPSGYYHSCCVTVAEGTAMAVSIRADRYVECSALTGEGMDMALDESASEATRLLIARATAERHLRRDN
ncbi:hypothetical protein L249_3176 [Ophiocordyceps polyrhachis-furcata BCC 54312]|uniref:Uncharacterized protein n=1 Tax=Ophiocordyceps polyrhachis-furcata BCC 54312 TaxID=1330021 RepID=A0A367LS01_9HYPO|nr:hypothetical protein L249_3176 [Ophiocordyceps polyrhachis-furcata BCC 54312]